MPGYEYTTLFDETPHDSVNNNELNMVPNFQNNNNNHQREMNHASFHMPEYEMFKSTQPDIISTNENIQISPFQNNNPKHMNSIQFPEYNIFETTKAPEILINENNLFSSPFQSNQENNQALPLSRDEDAYETDKDIIQEELKDIITVIENTIYKPLNSSKITTKATSIKLDTTTSTKFPENSTTTSTKSLLNSLLKLVVNKLNQAKIDSTNNISWLFEYRLFCSNKFESTLRLFSVTTVIILN